MSNKSTYFRMDFIQEVISFDEQTKTIEFKLIPDPRRYEWREIEDKKYLYDKLDNLLFSENVLDQLAKQAIGKQGYFQQQEIVDAEQYVINRIPIIKEILAGKETPSTLEDKSEAYLQSLSKDKLGFVILCVDIVDSTNLVTSLGDDKYSRLISIITYEISEIIPKFHGHVLKYTGDGLIAYFAEPSFIIKNDLALDCALTIRRLIYNALNHIFEENAFPKIDIRIGLDSGDAYVKTIGSACTKQHKDIIGGVVNLASKIQSLGNPGDILMGDITFKNLHTMWREICEEVKLDEKSVLSG